MSIRAATLSSLLGLGVCGTALADVPKVATDIAPVHSLVSRVMEGLGEPALIVRPGTSPHGYAMRPSEARSVQEAQAIFWVGAALEPWLEEALVNLSPDAETVALLAAPATQILEFRTGATFEIQTREDHRGEDQDAHDHAEAEQDHADEHDGPAQAGEEHGHEHERPNHSHEGVDPHAWLDPENGKAWLDIIAATLADLDPDNAEAYAANAEAGKAEIDAATSEARATLAPVADLRFVVFHDAYQYFETRFGLAAVGAIALSDASDPSPARVEDVQRAVKELGVTCVLAEPQFNQGLVRTVAEGSEVKNGVIDPMGSDIATGADYYPTLIRTVAEELAACGE